MKTFLAIILFGIAFSASADNRGFNKQVNLEVLQDELISGGFLVKHIDCRGTDCIIYMDASEKKDTATIVSDHIYVNPKNKRDTLETDIAALAVKLRSVGITADEINDLLSLMLEERGF